MISKFETVLSMEIKSVVVVLRIEPYYRSFDDYSGIQKMYLVKDDKFKFPRKLYIKLPVHLNYDGYLFDNKNSINALLVQEIEAISGLIKEEVDKQFIDDFDGVQFVIEYIGSEKFKDEAGIEEWKAFSTSDEPMVASNPRKKKGNE